MKALSQQELKLAEEMFTSTAKIISMIQYGEMDQDKLKRYEDFFIGRYRTIIGCSSCILLIKRMFLYRLATDTVFADPINYKTFFPKGRDYEKNTSFEECLIISKGIFKTSDYEGFYTEVFKNAYDKAREQGINDFNDNPANMVRGVVSNCVLTLIAYMLLYNVTSGNWDIMKCLDYLNDKFPGINNSNRMVYYSSYTDERTIYFELLYNLMQELEAADPSCVKFEEKEEKAV